MGLQRLSSNGPVPNVSGMAQGHRGALVALGAVALGAAWAWKSNKENRLLIKAAPGDADGAVPPAQKSSGRRRNKRHKARPTEPALEESASSEATGKPFQAPVLSSEPAMSDTASTDDPITEAESASTLDVSDDTSLAVASRQAVGGLPPNATLASSAPVPRASMVVTTPQATSPMSPVAEADDSEWNVVERRRPRRTRSPPSTEGLAGFVGATGTAADVHEDASESGSGPVSEKLADAEPELEPEPVFSSELPSPEEAGELVIEPAAAGSPPSLPSPSSDVQKKQKKKKRRQKEELDSPSDGSHSGSAPLWAVSGAAEQEAALPTPLGEDSGHPGLAGQVVDQDTVGHLSTAEAIAAVARLEAAEDASAGTAGGQGDGWATVTRRRPRRLAAGEERPSAGGSDILESPEEP
jgi:hypothetical protein